MPRVLLAPRTAFLAVGLLLACALGIATYGTCAVLVGTSEAAASAIAVVVQTAWQTLLVRWLHGGPPWWWATQAPFAVAAFGLAGAVGLSGGSAFFAVAGVVVVVLPAGAVACAWWAAARRAVPRRGALSAGDGR